jgi:transcriptional regulator with XRE-family HTH domain
VPVSGRTAARWHVGNALRTLRQDAHVTVEQVEQARLASRPKLWRLETGQVRVTVPDVWALAGFYDAGQEKIDELTEWAKKTHDLGLWQPYREVIPEWFKLYVGLEEIAARIDTFEDSVVPGELQTPEYARALWHGAWPGLPADDIEPHIALRMRRQEALFDRPAGRRLSVVLGESVLRRQVGGAGVMAVQRERLTQLSGRPGVDIRILPFAAGAHPATTGAFRLLAFDNKEDPDLVYVENETGAQYLEKLDYVQQYRRIAARLAEQTVPIGEFAA